MLRRKPTAITLTSEDLSAYEDRQAREALVAAQAQAQAAAQAQQLQAQGQAQGLVTPQKAQNVNPGEEGRQAPAVEKKKTREERLGIASQT